MKIQATVGFIIRAFPAQLAVLVLRSTCLESGWKNQADFLSNSLENISPKTAWRPFKVLGVFIFTEKCLWRRFGEFVT